MVNNEFHLIGTAISNFAVASQSGNFVKYRFSLEIEILGSNVGKVNRVDIEVYSTNRAIKIDQQILGKQVAVNGYIDSFVNRNGATFVKLIAQNLMVFDTPVVVEAVSNPNTEPPLPTEPEEEPLNDDDLPF